MTQLNPKLIAGYLAIAVCGAARADVLSGFFDDYQRARKEGVTTHVLDIDNDTLLLNKNDGFYTSGLRYTQIHTMNGAGQMTSFGWRIGQELYTASDIKLPPALIGPPNHPYAGWLYGGLYKEVHREDGTHLRVGVDVGCMGPCAGGYWTQTNFHRVIDQPLPRGWSKQVRNEAGVVLYGDMAPVRWQVGQHADITPGVNGRFGNIFTDVGVGVTARAGRLDALPNGRALYGYVRTDVHAVGYNATLQGGYFSSGNPHTVEPKRVVGEAEIGMMWREGPYGARLGLVRRGNEIRDLPNSIGAQNYLHLQFSYTP
jgi:hypothetical protein